MASDNLITDQLPAASLPKVSILTMIRLGLFQVGLGMMSVMTFGVLNRVLIKELNVPGTIATLMLALTYFVAPARVWFGQRSDSHPLFGYHRTGYVWIGAASLALTSMVAVRVMWRLGNSLATSGWSTATYGWTVLLAILFGIYGLAVSASSTPFATLLVDITDEDDRSKIVSVDWSMLLGGVIIGAITISKILEKLQADAPIALVQAQINQLFTIVPLTVCVLALIGTWQVEKKYSRFSQRRSPQNGASPVGLGQAWQILNNNRQTKVFFVFLICMTLGLFMQDPVLETYGGQVFGMSIGETAKLNAFFGIGTLTGLLLTGFILIPKIGKQRSTKLGCSLVAASMLWVIVAGFTHKVMFLKMALVLFGLFSGMVTTGALTLMLDLTLPETAGTFIGAWGLSQALAKGFATILGGAGLDVGKKIFLVNGTDTDLATSPGLVLAYGLVFAMQASVMIVAIWLLGRVNVKEFQSKGHETLQAVVGNSID
jgi:MFS transporter, BCD family, chlorophyll transporter